MFKRVVLTAKRVFPERKRIRFNITDYSFWKEPTSDYLHMLKTVILINNRIQYINWVLKKMIKIFNNIY
jgi:hypothetical protein